MDAWDQASQIVSQTPEMNEPAAPQAPAPQGPTSAGGQFYNAAMKSGIDPLAKGVIRAAGRVGLIPQESGTLHVLGQDIPYRGMKEAMSADILPTDPNRLAAKAGGFIGAPAAAIATGPWAPAVMAIQAAENARENVDARNEALRLQGQQELSGTQQVANVGGQAALAYGMGRLMPGQKLGGKIMGMTPTLENAALNAGKNIAVGMGVGAVENDAFTIAANALNKGTNVDPNASLTQGLGEAAIGGAAFGGFGQGMHEAGTAAGRLFKPRAEALEQPVAQPHDNAAAQPLEGAAENKQSVAVHAPDDRSAATATEQGNENVSKTEGPAAPVEAQPPVPQARSEEGAKLPENPQGNPPEGSAGVQPGTEGPAAKSLPELPAGHEGWSYKQLKDWAGENGFETEGAKGKLTLRNKLSNQLLSQEKSLRRTEPLTGAPNTIKYHEDAANIFKDADAKNEHTALVETDIGGLKVMNTVYGHEGGDEMLKLAHQAMREELRVPPQRNGRSQDYLGSSAYRTGGDEFPLILRDVDSPEKAKVVMDRVNANFDKKLAEKFPDLPAEARPFIAHNAEIRKPGDTRSIAEMRSIADKGVEPVKSAIKAQRNIPEGRTDLLNYIKERQQKAGTESNTLAGGRRAGAVAVPESVNKLFERDVRPAVEDTKGNLSKSWDAINRFAGTGAQLSEKQRDIHNDIRTTLGQQEVHIGRLETAIKPYRDVMKTMTPDERAAWVDQVEATGATASKNAQGINMPGQSSDPRLQGLADLSHDQNVKNIKDAEKYGIAEANKWDANWVGRDFSDEGNGDRTSVGGSQAFRIKREFDTYSDAKAAVEQAGHKLRFDNEADMLLYKQAQVRKNIDARRMMYEAEDRGQLKWVPEDEKNPETHDTDLKDRLAQQDRDVVGPKWLVAKLAKLEHFDAQKFLDSDEWKKNTQVLRPGDTMPTDLVKTGQTVKGTFAGDANTAGLFNNLISAGVNSHAPALKQIAQLRRAVTASNLAIPAAHASLETIGNAVTMGANALDNLVHGELGLAGKNAMRALNPFAANKLGRQVREQAADPTTHPALENIVQTVQRGGNKFDLKSVLNQDSLKDAQTEWKEGNKIGAVPRLIKGIYSKAVGPLFEHFIPNIKAAYKAAAAETAIARGMSGSELDRHMSKVQDNADNILGMVKRDFQFQHRIVTDIEDIAFNAPKFAEGTIRFAGAATRDTAQALKAVATGKSPTVTPAMYTALSGLVMHSIGAAMFQMAYSKATTGTAQMPDKLEDYIRPRTGRVDDKGREQRVSVLSPFSFLFSAGKDMGKSLTSRTATLWRSAKNVADNADERNVQIANPNDSFLKRMKDRAAYMGKEAMPFAAQNLMQNKQEGHKTTADQVAGEAMGFHYSYGAATPAEKAALDTVYGHARQAPRTREEADKSDMIRGLSERVRSKDPTAMADVRKAVRDGKLGPSDVQTIHKRAIEAPGLKGILGQADLGAKDIMEQVWPKMSAKERQENQWMIRGKVGRAENLNPADRQRFFKQINSDMKAGAA